MPQRTYDLKPLSPDTIDAAFDKMRRYRLLNEPDAAESICRDILRIAPDLRDAKVGLLLCLTDQFGRKLAPRWQAAVEVVETLEDEYDRAYYFGIMCERRAKAHYARKNPQKGGLAFGWLEKAMAAYETAEACRPDGDDSAILRWNTCARIIMQHDSIAPEPAEDGGPGHLGE